MTESRWVVAKATGRKGLGHMVFEGYKESFGDDTSAYYLDCGVGLMGVHMWKLTKSCILNMCSLLYVNCTTKRG